jgi:hypothetical protein
MENQSPVARGKVTDWMSSGNNNVYDIFSAKEILFRELVDTKHLARA